MAKKIVKKTAKTAKKTAKKSKTVQKTAIKKTAKKAAAKKVAKKITKKATQPAKKAIVAKKATAAPAVTVGQRVPDFTLPSTASAQFQLNEHQGKKIVLYFYPKDATSGCTIEGDEFSKLIQEFHNKNTLVYGVSRDNLKSHTGFKNNRNFQFDLLSDANETACQIFDVIKEKNMYGNKVMGIERSTFLIGEDGQLLKEWRKVKAEGHAQEVLNAID